MSDIGKALASIIETRQLAAEKQKASGASDAGARSEVTAWGTYVTMDNRRTRTRSATVSAEDS